MRKFRYIFSGILIKLFLIISLIALNTKALHAQKYKLDSLEKRLEQTQSDSGKFEIFIQLSNTKSNNKALKDAQAALTLAKNKLTDKEENKALINLSDVCNSKGHYKKALSYLSRASELSLKNGRFKDLSLAYYKSGITHYKNNNFNESLNYHLKALKYRKKLKNIALIAESLNTIGLMHWRMGNFKEAEAYFLKSIKKRKPLNDIEGISIAYNNLGALHWGRSNYNKALEYFLLALKQTNTSKNKRRAVLITNNIGLIYQEWDDYANALKYHKEARTIAEEIDYHFGLAYSYINLGSCYKHFKNYDLALNYYKKSLENYTIEQKIIGISLSYRHISNVYYLKKDYKKAVKNGKLALKYARQVQSKHHIAFAHKTLSENYLVIKKYALAEIEAKKALDIAQENRYKEVIKDAAYALSEVYKHNKEFKKSLSFYTMATNVKDSIYNEEKSKQIAEMQTKYETEKKQNEIKLKNAELEAKNAEIKQRKNFENALLIVISLILIIVVIIIYTNFKMQKAKNEINKKKDELEEVNKKLVQLSQFKETLTAMIVHDLKNPLNIINNLTNQPEIKEPANRMHTLIMNILDISKFESSKMKVEIKSVNLYQVITNAFEQVKFLIQRKNICFSNLINEELRVFADQEKLERVIVNLVHNAIKYTPNNGKIKIHSELKAEDIIIVKVTDNGQGIPKERQKDIFIKFGQYKPRGIVNSASTGLGLTFCQLAMEAINQKIGLESDRGKGTSFWISLKPANQNVTDTTENDKYNEQFDFQLSNEEKLKVRNFSKELIKSEIFEITKLKSILKEVKKNESPAITKWRTKVENSILNLNEEMFRELCSL